MNIPEGWPTDEMILAAGKAVGINMVNESIKRALVAALSAAPTPEVEPVILPTDDELEKVLIPLMYKRLSRKAIEELTYTSWKDGIDIQCLGQDMRSLIKEVLLIYTHPASDELRKAAEEIVNWWRTGTGSPEKLVIELSDALDKVRS